MATNTIVKKPELKWLHDFQNSFTDLDLTFRQEGFSGAKSYLGRSPLKRMFDYYSQSKFNDFNSDFKSGIQKEMNENPNWANLVDNQIEYVNQAKSPEEFQEAFQKLKKLF